MNIFEASNNYIVHETDADLTLRPVPIPVHLVQGDTTMPVLMVHLYDGGAQYSIPSSFSANLRLRKPDGTIVENIGAAGQNDDGTAVYFVITSAMASAAGLCVGVVELTRSGNIAASSRILIQVDRNPIQDGDEDSVSEINLIMAFENAGSFYVSDSQPSANAPYLWFDTSEG